MRRSRLIKLAVVCLSVLGCGAVGYRIFGPMRPIPPHQGDGTFQDISRRAVIPVYGYSIRLPEFDLGKEYRAEYRLTRLPEIGRKCGVYLAINDRRPSDRVNPRLRSSVRLELLDSQGRVVAEAGGELRDFVWGNWRGADRLYMSSSFFVPASAEEYALRINYVPESALASFTGYAYLECGGSK